MAPPKRRDRQSPVSPESPCPRCGSKDIYRVVRRQGERFKALSDQATGYSRLDGDYRIPYRDHLEHQCRACQKLWGTRLNGRVKEVGKVCYGRVGNIPTVPFKVEAILPIFFCKDCGADYTVFRQGGMMYEDTPKFCPYCGVKDPGPSLEQQDWLSRLREDSLKAQPRSSSPVDDQRDPVPGSSGNGSIPGP